MDDREGKLQVGSAMDEMGFWEKRSLQRVVKFLERIGLHVTPEELIEFAASGVTLREADEVIGEAKERERKAKEAVEEAEGQAKDIIRSATAEVRRLVETSEELEGHIGELRHEAERLEGIIAGGHKIEYTRTSEGKGVPTATELDEENKKRTQEFQEKEGESLEYADRVIPLVRGTASDVEVLVQRERTERSLPTSETISLLEEGRMRMMRLLGIAKAYYDSHITESRVEIKMPNGMSLSDFIESRLKEIDPIETRGFQPEYAKKLVEAFVEGYISTLPEDEQRKAGTSHSAATKILERHSRLANNADLLATPIGINPVRVMGSTSQRVKGPENLHHSEELLQAILDSDDEIFRLYGYDHRRETRHEYNERLEAERKEKEEREQAEREENEQ